MLQLRSAPFQSQEMRPFSNDLKMNLWETLVSTTLSTADRWTTWIWTAWVHLYTHFYNKCNVSSLYRWTLHPQMQSTTDLRLGIHGCGGPTACSVLCHFMQGTWAFSDFLIRRGAEPILLRYQGKTQAFGKSEATCGFSSVWERALLLPHCSRARAALTWKLWVTNCMTYVQLSLCLTLGSCSGTVKQSRRSLNFWSTAQQIL